MILFTFYGNIFHVLEIIYIFSVSFCYIYDRRIIFMNNKISVLIADDNKELASELADYI